MPAERDVAKAVNPESLKRPAAAVAKEHGRTIDLSRPAATPSYQSGTRSDDEAIAEKLDIMAREQAAELDKLSRRVLIPKSMQREGTEAVLTKVETRLHILEQSYAELEKKHTAGIEALQERIDASVDTVKALRLQWEKTENVNREAFAELHLGIFNLEKRAGAEKKAVLAPDPASAPVTEPEIAPSLLLGRERAAGAGRLAFLEAARTAAKEAAAPEYEPENALKAAPVKIALFCLALVAVVGYGIWRFVPSGEPLLPSRIAASLPVGGGAAMPAKTEDTNAQLKLGDRYLNGNGRMADVSRGTALIAAAAGRGNPVAANYLGALYRSGTGVEKNMGTAVRWFEAAAQKGNLQAMATLGMLYAGGWKEGTDYGKAFVWLDRAARHGDAASAYRLAVLYELGEGVSVSLSDAFKWYSVAAGEGNDYAAKRARELAAYLPAADRSLAGMVAADFKPLPLDPAANDVAGLHPPG